MPVPMTTALSSGTTRFRRMSSGVQTIGFSTPGIGGTVHTAPAARNTASG